MDIIFLKKSNLEIRMDDRKGEIGLLLLQNLRWISIVRWVDKR